MPNAELADFSPDNGHLHDCPRNRAPIFATLADGTGMPLPSSPCDCALQLYELAAPGPVYLFAWGYYEARGGWDDLVATCSTVQEAMECWAAWEWLKDVAEQAVEAWRTKYPGGQWSVVPDANDEYQQLAQDHRAGMNDYANAQVVIGGRCVTEWAEGMGWHDAEG